MSQIDAKARQGDWFLADAAATAALGAELAALLLAGLDRGDGGLLLLHGDLGAGKTTLVQGLAAALGIDEPVTSPSYALAQHYSGRLADGRATGLVHLDLYRLEQPASADELFDQEAEEALASGAVLAVEWPERLSVPPPAGWWLTLAAADRRDPDAGRRARLRPAGAPPAP
jgi:tRNA threonylcarbamoyladenosine biosynthesis protein TsaE